MTEIPASQAWFWTEEWQAGEREADAEIAAGLGTVYDSGEEFLAALERMDETDTRQAPAGENSGHQVNR